VTSVKELKKRLGEFLAYPQSEQDFRDWFALALRDAHKSGEAAEVLAHKIVWAFLDHKRGFYSTSELVSNLSVLAKPDPEIFWGSQPFAVVTGTTSNDPQMIPALEVGGLWVGESRALESA